MLLISEKEKIMPFQKHLTQGSESDFAHRLAFAFSLGRMGRASAQASRKISLSRV
jgi:hypothetical protein